jgi:hypothetical protein
MGSEQPASREFDALAFMQRRRGAAGGGAATRKIARISATPLSWPRHIGAGKGYLPQTKSQIAKYILSGAPRETGRSGW